MRHDWVFDVLSDLLAYATQNGLPRLAAKVSETIDEARREIGPTEIGPTETGPTESGPDESGPDEPPQAPPTPGRRMH